MAGMVRDGYLVALALAFPLLLTGSCGSKDPVRRATDPSEGGAPSRGGESGDPGASGSPTEPGSGTSDAGGEGPEPSGGGSSGGGDSGGGRGGASNGNGGAASAPGGSSHAGAGGEGSSSDAFVSGCTYPGGGDCDELTGTLEETIEFENQCLFNERIPLDACPRVNVAGFCTWTQSGPTIRNFHYSPIEPDELADAEQNCLEIPGEWTVP